MLRDLQLGKDLLVFLVSCEYIASLLASVQLHTMPEHQFCTSSTMMANINLPVGNAFCPSQA